MRFFRIDWYGFAQTRGAFGWHVGPTLRWNTWARYAPPLPKVSDLFPLVSVSRQSDRYFTYS